MEDLDTTRRPDESKKVERLKEEIDALRDFALAEKERRIIAEQGREQWRQCADVLRKQLDRRARIDQETAEARLEGMRKASYHLRESHPITKAVFRGFARAMRRFMGGIRK